MVRSCRSPTFEAHLAIVWAHGARPSCNGTAGALWVKRCSQCEVAKPSTGFSREARDRGRGLEARCKECRRTSQRSWRRAVREAGLERPALCGICGAQEIGAGESPLVVDRNDFAGSVVDVRQVSGSCTSALLSAALAYVTSGGES